MSVQHTIAHSPVGPLTLVRAGAALVGLYFEGHRRTPRLAERGLRVDTGFDAPIQQLSEYFSGTRREFDLELAPRGSRSRRRSGHG